MRTLFIGVVVASIASTVATAQQERKPSKTVTLSGCVERDESAPGQYTITDEKNGTYRVTGKDFREFLGVRVQLDGGVVIKGLKISGGLQPNPNIAGQAGAIDPARAAVQAATSGPNAGPANDVPEFRVKTIKRTGGSCQ